MDEKIEDIPEIMVSGGLLTIALVIMCLNFSGIGPTDVPWSEVSDPSGSQLALFSTAFLAVAYVLGRLFSKLLSAFASCLDFLWYSFKIRRRAEHEDASSRPKSIRSRYREFLSLDDQVSVKVMATESTQQLARALEHRWRAKLFLRFLVFDWFVLGLAAFVWCANHEFLKLISWQTISFAVLEVLFVWAYLLQRASEQRLRDSISQMPLRQLRKR